MRRMSARLRAVESMASAHYQPARFTEAIDLMVLAEEATAVEQALRTAGWSQLGVISFGGSSWQSAKGESIDLLHAPDQSWVAAALDAPVKTPEGLQIIDLPYLIILKLSATRAVLRTSRWIDNDELAVGELVSISVEKEKCL